MPRRVIPSFLLALTCIVVLGAVTPAAGALTRDAQTRQNVRLLKTYIDAYAGEHRFVFPADALVRKGGVLTAPIWPVNPWTGRAMAPGTGRGAYSYVPNPGGDGYTLTARLTSGWFAVRGATPAWLNAERSSAATALKEAQAAADAAETEAAAARQARDDALAQLAASEDLLAAAQADLAQARVDLLKTQADLTAVRAQRDAALADLSAAVAARDAAVAARDAAVAARDSALAQLGAARDTATKSGLGMIQEVLRGLAQGLGVLPTKDTLTFASVGSSWPAWPYSPFDGQRMSQGSAPGQFTYTPGADGSWTLVAHLSSGDYTLTQGAVDWAVRKDQLTIQGATFISYGLEVDAIMNNDLYPATLSHLTLSTVDPWPVNPFFSRDMADGSSKGDFDYSVSGEGMDYSLVANLTDGSTYDVAAWTQPLFAPLWRLRTSLKDFVVQGHAQVLKDYVDQWKLEHAGALPTAGQMSAAGAVGASHTWWPKDPWTLSPMAPGTGPGSYEYVPGAQGAFTITVHQVPLPMVNGQSGTEIPATYTAQ